jgi:hypothetical protein
MRADVHDNRDKKLQLLCFGYYKETVDYADKEYSLQPLKDAGVGGKEWHIDPCNEPGKYHTTAAGCYCSASLKCFFIQACGTLLQLTYAGTEPYASATCDVIVATECCLLCAHS